MSLERRGKGPTLAAGAALLLVGLALLVYFSDELKGWYVVWTSFERIETNPQGYAEFRHRRTGIVFVRLPGGPCTLGVSQEDIAEWLSRQGLNLDDKWSHRMASHAATTWTPCTVRVSPFFMAKDEVSKAQWQSVMDDFSSAPSPEPLVEAASWYSFHDFCEHADLAIPTEAQWEYAFGNPLRPSPADGATNTFGLRRRSWKVWEWCRDSYDDTFYTSGVPTGPDPVCSAPSNQRVLRGAPLGRMGAPASQSGANVFLRPVFSLRM